MSQRVDAARNRQRVLDAALVEHARHGGALGMQEVARRAGVGIGTVYRHFPSRQALIEAIAHPFFERGLGIARAIEQECEEQDRFASFIRRFARELADSGVLGQCLWDAPAAEPVRAELRLLVAGFVASATQAGTLRADLTAEDGFALLWTIASLAEVAGDAIWQRHIDLVLDGLRGGEPRALLAPPVDRAQWDEFVRSTRERVEARS
jgi:AcrR family transcriptional regulator